MTTPILLHTAYLAFASTSLVLWITFAIRAGYRKQSLPSVGAVVKLVELVWAAAAPVRYMTSPPTVPPREKLLKNDECSLNVPISPGWRRRNDRLSMSVVIQAFIVIAFGWPA